MVNAVKEAVALAVMFIGSFVIVIIANNGIAAIVDTVSVDLLIVALLLGALAGERRRKREQ